MARTLCSDCSQVVSPAKTKRVCRHRLAEDLGILSSTAAAFISSSAEMQERQQTDGVAESGAEGRRREETHWGQRQPEATARNTSVTLSPSPLRMCSLRVSEEEPSRRDTCASVKTRDRLLGYQATLHASCTPHLASDLAADLRRRWLQRSAPPALFLLVPIQAKGRERARAHLAENQPGQWPSNTPPPRAERTAGLVSVPLPTIRLQLGLRSTSSVGDTVSNVRKKKQPL